MSFHSGSYGIISFSDYFSKGISEINLLKGEAFNLDPAATIKRIAFDGAKKFNMGRIKSLALFTDADVHIGMSHGNLENDMNTFMRTMRPLDLETIRIKQSIAYVPDKYLVIFVGSDDPNFEYNPASLKPHIFYSNSVPAIESGFTTLFLRHTILDVLKFKIINEAGPTGKLISLDIQHVEVLDENGNVDANDAWTSYEGYPLDVAIGGVHVFGDNMTVDTRHHFHRVRVKTKTIGDQSVVKGAMFGV